jgi:putative lipoic acid-binding regulatory protein
MTEESAIEFPCEFPVKMMGHNSPEFRLTARALIEKHTDTVAESAIKESLSRNERFVSITITVTATSQQQLDDIYQDVSDHEDVLMAL